MPQALADRYNSISNKWEYDLGNTGSFTQYPEAYQNVTYGERVASLHYDGNDEFLWHHVFKQGKEYLDDTPAFLASIDGNSNNVVSLFEFLASSYHGN